MFYSRTASAGTSDALSEPILRALSVAPADEAASGEILITEQEVLFATAAALPARRQHISRRFGAVMRGMFAVSAHASGPPRRHVPKRYEFLERAVMGREMDRL